ncbi:MAG TPA: alpha/beta hydrolase [Nitrospirae bacterium]|nr:alpha/beta hydrolase [Nitrospirota bacterium]
MRSGLDTVVHKGRDDRPVGIFIHGLGVDRDIWIDPMNTRIFAKNVPLKIFAASKPGPTCQYARKISIGTIPERINNLWAALRDDGFSIICWSQGRPAGPISVAAEELGKVVSRAKRIFPGKPIALIGHSRGGLVARKFMERKRAGIKALITISTPHAGSSIALLGKYLKPFSAVLKNVLPKEAHGTVSRAIKNVADLLKGSALKELLPDSVFFENLRDSFQKGVSYLSFGGTEPRFFTVYMCKRTGRGLHPRPLLSIPDSLLKITPSFLITDEITPGKGDGLVSAKSSLMPWSSEHHNIRANHVSIMWDRKVIKSTLGVMKAI